jgi:hypothetical protein
VIDALEKYVAQISGVITICGAVVVVMTAIILTELNRAFHYHMTGAEITWASFVAGVAASGLISVVYGFALSGIPGSAAQVRNRDNRQAAIAFIFGSFLIVLAILGFLIPATG